MRQPHEVPPHGAQGRNLFVPEVTKGRASTEGYKVGLSSTTLTSRGYWSQDQVLLEFCLPGPLPPYL